MRPPSVNPHMAPRTPTWKTPAWQGGATPNVQAAKTPAWHASSRTPNPYLDSGGGKTPAWNVSSRTPNPYGDGGKTPAWNVSSRTPNPYASGGGGGSGWGSSGGGGGGGGGGNWGSNNWGGRTPGRTNDTSSDWQADNWVSRCDLVSARPVSVLTPSSGCADTKGSTNALRCRSYSRVLRADAWIRTRSPNNSAGRRDYDPKHPRLYQRPNAWCLRRIKRRWYECFP